MEPDEKIMARLKPGCICKGVKLFRLVEAIKNGASSFEEVAKIAGIGDGDCDGKRCSQKVEMLLTQEQQK